MYSNEGCLPRVIYNFLTIRLRTQMLIKVICTNQKENNANKGVVQRLHYSNGALMLGLWHVTNPAIWAFCCPLVLQGLEPCRIVLQFTNFLGMLKVPCSIRAPESNIRRSILHGGCIPRAWLRSRRNSRAQQARQKAWAVRPRRWVMVMFGRPGK